MDKAICPMNSFSRKSVRLLKSTLLVLGVSFLLLELVGLLIPSNHYYWYNRQLFVSQNAFRPIGENGLWTYQPNSQIQTAATYFLTKQYGWLEYRCNLQTNSLGLTQTNYTDQKQVNFLVLGDSFTEGLGGCPWLTKENLEKEKVKATVINGGLQGGGIANFELLADWLEPQVKIDNLIIVAISNDFKRGLIANAWKNHDGCLKEGKCSDNPEDDFVWGVDPKISDQQMLEMGKRRFAFASSNHKQSTTLHNLLDYHSFTYRLFLQYRSAFTKPKHPPETAEQLAGSPLIQSNFAALNNLRARYPNLQLILVPQRDEVGLLGAPNLDTQAVKQRLTQEQVPFTQCDLTSADYMPIDGHPNQQGYQKILACTIKAMGSTQPAKAKVPEQSVKQ
jgi:lysophospholipase L1-like esterase